MPAARHPTVSGTSGTGLFTGDRLHEVVLDLDDATFQQALSTFQQSGERTWLEVAVTLDGTTYERCGLRLKGTRRCGGPTRRRGRAVPVAGAPGQGWSTARTTTAPASSTTRPRPPATAPNAAPSPLPTTWRRVRGRCWAGALPSGGGCAPEQVSSTVGGRAPGSALVVARLMATGRGLGAGLDRVVVEGYMGRHGREQPHEADRHDREQQHQALQDLDPRGSRQGAPQCRIHVRPPPRPGLP